MFLFSNYYYVADLSSNNSKAEKLHKLVTISQGRTTIKKWKCAKLTKLVSYMLIFTGTRFLKK